MAAHPTQIGQPEQDEIQACAAGISKETIDGLARRFSFVILKAAYEKVKTHMVFDNGPDALDLVIAQVEGTAALRGDFRSLDIMVKEPDSSGGIHGPSSGFLNVMIERGKKQRSAN
jgi:hypothetical protein